MANEVKWEPTEEQKKAYEAAVEYQKAQGVEKKWRMPSNEKMYGEFIKKFGAPEKEAAKEGNAFDKLTPKQKKFVVDMQNAAKKAGIKVPGKDGKEYAFSFNKNSANHIAAYNSFRKKAIELGLYKEKAQDKGAELGK